MTSAMRFRGPDPLASAPVFAAFGADDPEGAGLSRWARPSYGSPRQGSRDFGVGLVASFVQTARGASLRQALTGVACRVLVTAPMRQIRSSSPGFAFRGRHIEYLPEPLATERRAELPLGLEFLRDASPGEQVLEVGNVLHRYPVRARDVVDLYERGPGVIQADIVGFEPGKRYDRIVSISTLEHVGYDEPVTEPGKFRRAFDHLVNDLLAETGRMLVTLPLCYNPEVDRFVRDPGIARVTVTILRRTSSFNEWEEVTGRALDLRDLSRRYPGASAIAVVSIEGPALASRGG